MASGQTVTSTLSGRYATALFELALERNAIDSIAADLAHLAEMIGESEELRYLIHSPLFSRDSQRVEMMWISIFKKSWTSWELQSSRSRRK